MATELTISLSFSLEYPTSVLSAPGSGFATSVPVLLLTDFCCAIVMLSEKEISKKDKKVLLLK
jgi:hypothetical protein